MSGGKYIAPQVIENKLKESMFIEQAMVIGENEKFASALIVPAFGYIENWLKQQGIETTLREDIIVNPLVVTKIQNDVIEVNKTLGQVEEIKRYRLVTDDWTSDTGELSPTQKLKRNVIASKYSHLISEIFSSSYDEERELPPLKKLRMNLSFAEIISKLKNNGNGK